MRARRTNFENKNPFPAIYSKEYNQVFKKPFKLLKARLYFASKFPIGIFDVINLTANGTKYYLKNIKYISKKNYISIKYEDLCKEPNKVITNIMEFLNLKSDQDFNKLMIQCQVN